MSILFRVRQIKLSTQVLRVKSREDFWSTIEGTKTTRSKKPWKLIYSEAHETREKARQREKYWKSGIGREQRAALLKTHGIDYSVEATAR